MDADFQPLFWHWWSLGLVLIILEIFLPGTFFLWIGIAAGVLGLLLLIFPDMPLTIQLLVLTLISVGSIFAWIQYERTHPTTSPEPALNRRGHQYVGRTFVLEQDIVEGYGRIRADDSTWKVAGPDRPAGSRVRVTGIEGTVLQVEPAPATEKR